jgi:hypothetical protein
MFSLMPLPAATANRRMLGGFKQQNLTPQFCRLEVPLGSDWAKDKVVAELALLEGLGRRFPAVSGCLAPLCPPSRPAASHSDL